MSYSFLSQKAQLQEALACLSIDHSVDAEALLYYLELLLKWNNAYNLTAVPPEQWVLRHIIDSLAILPWIQGDHVADIGTGAGLPGIPLAIVCPAFHWTLMDSNGKKIRFLQDVKTKLGLSQVTLVHSRAEAYTPPVLFDTIVTRAFSRIEQMIRWTRPLLSSQGIWVAMKGKRAEVLQEGGLPPSAVIYDYSLPGMHERTAVLISATALDCE